MAVVQLANATDVADAFGRELTSEESARVGSILDKASELFRLHSGQEFTPGRSEVKLKVNGGETYLPQRPVTVIHSVTDERGDDVLFTQFKQWVRTSRLSHEFIVVDYSHGSEDVPNLVRLAVAEIAKKVLSVDPNAAAGVTQRSETTGPFTDSWTYATWAVGGQTMLAPDDLNLALSYKVKVPTVWVQQP